MMNIIYFKLKKENSNIKIIDYLKEVNSSDNIIIYTDINRDGMKTSPNFKKQCNCRNF